VGWCYTVPFLQQRISWRGFRCRVDKFARVVTPTKEPILAFFCFPFFVAKRRKVMKINETNHFSIIILDFSQQLPLVCPFFGLSLFSSSSYTKTMSLLLPLRARVSPVSRGFSGLRYVTSSTSATSQPAPGSGDVPVPEKPSRFSGISPRKLLASVTAGLPHTLLMTSFCHLKDKK